MKSSLRLLSALGLSLCFTTLSAKELTVYTYSSFTSSWGPGPQLKTLFEAQCDCTLNYVSSDDGVSLLNRLRLEGASTRADVVLGLDDALMEQTRSLGLVQPHQLDLSNWPLNPDLAWTDTDFIPFDYGYFAFIYDTHKIETPVDSLEALLNSDASIIYQDPRTSTPGQGLMLWMQKVYGEDVHQAWQRLARNTVTVTKGWSEAYGMFLQGEADYVLSYTTSPAYHVVAEESDQYQAALFTEGHVAQIELAAVTASSKQVELAQAFLQFLLSEEAQTVIPTTNWMLPVRTDIELPEVFLQTKPQRIGFSPEETEAGRETWLRTWRNAVSR